MGVYDKVRAQGASKNLIRTIQTGTVLLFCILILLATSEVLLADPIYYKGKSALMQSSGPNNTLSVGTYQITLTAVSSTPVLGLFNVQHNGTQFPSRVCNQNEPCFFDSRTGDAGQFGFDKDLMIVVEIRDPAQSSQIRVFAGVAVSDPNVVQLQPQTASTAEEQSITFRMIADAIISGFTILPYPQGGGVVVATWPQQQTSFNPNDMSIAITPPHGSTGNYNFWIGATWNGTGNTAYAANVQLTVTQGLTLSVLRTGTGNGTVTSSPSGINCGSSCSASFTSGTPVTLTATPDANSSFASWNGCDSISGSQCTVTMNASRSVTATFNALPPQTFALTVTKAGTGNGTVTSSPGVINCGATCSANFTSGTVVTLTATPASGSTFAGWSGDSDCSDGSVTMNANRSCTATFNTSPGAFTLTVVKVGNGSGTVTSSPAGINCGSTCSKSFTSGIIVTLTAAPASGSTFSGWSGDPDCSDGSVTMSASKSCTATFVATAQNLSLVANAGPDQVVTDSDNNGSESVTLDGSRSYDLNGEIVSYMWTELGALIANVKKPTVTFSLGTHSIVLTVTDDRGATDSDVVEIKVNPPANLPDLTVWKAESGDYIVFHNLESKPEPGKEPVSLANAKYTTIGVTIHNQGNTFASHVRVRIRDQSTNQTLLTDTINSIEPGGNGYVSYIWALSRNIESHRIRVDILSADQRESDTSNNSAETTVSIYYANSADPFNMQEDAYKYPNHHDIIDYNVTDARADLEALFMPLTNPFYKSLKPPLAGILLNGGWCFGFSATSILYRDDPSLKPVQENTYDMDVKNDSRVREKIKDYQRNQLPYFPDSLIGGDPATEYARVENYIKSQGKSIMLMMRDPGLKEYISGPLGGFLVERRKAAGHTIVAYKIISQGNQRKVYVYDNNDPYNAELSRAGADFVVFDIGNHTFEGPQYDNFNNDNTVSSRPLYGTEQIYSQVIARYPNRIFTLTDVPNILNSLFTSFVQSLSQFSQISVVVGSPVDVLVTDESGKSIGTLNGSIINEIPAASIETPADFKYFLLPSDHTYDVTVTGTDSGTFDLTYLLPDVAVKGVSYENVPTQFGAVNQIKIGKEIIDYSMTSDSNGDGNIDSTQEPEHFSEDVTGGITVGSRGDVNADGQINVIDARICLQKSLGLIPSSSPDPCDVDGDTAVTQADAQKIAQFSIGLISSLAAAGALAGLTLLLGLPLWLRRGKRTLGMVAAMLLSTGLLLTSCAPLIPVGASGLTASISGDEAIIIDVQDMPGGGLAALEAKAGGFTFNPKVLEVTEILPELGWTLLAGQIDNSAGEVRFAVVNPAGGVETDAVLTLKIKIKGSDDLRNLKAANLHWDNTKLTLGDANNQEILASQYQTAP